MKEKKLLILALLVSVLGLISLYIISEKITINDTTIEKITNEEITGNVVVQGQILDITKTDKVSLITLSQKKDILVVAFSNVSLNRGDHVEVHGRVEEYNNKKEIIADKIELQK